MVIITRDDLQRRFHGLVIFFLVYHSFTRRTQVCLYYFMLPVSYGGLHST